MSGAPGVSTERLNILLGHVSHKGFDDLVDPKNQGIAYPTANPDFLVTGDPLFYTNLLATLDMFRLNSANLTFGSTEEGNQFRRRQKLTRTKFSFRCTRENLMPKHCWDSYLRQVKAMVVDHFVRSVRHQSKTYPNTTRCSSLALKFLRDQQSSVKYKGTSESLEPCVML